MSRIKTKNKRTPCVLRERKTRFVEIFRTTPTGTVCPNFYVLAHANGCAFSPRCSYCYLKSSFWYLQDDQAFTNIEQMIGEIKAWIARDKIESHILNMGNLSDSLSFEHVRPLTLRLVELFRTEAEKKGRKHSLLLVTKGGLRECRPLLESATCENVIVSFSVNNEAAAREHENGAAPVSERMEAAQLLKKKGWRIRIRIDPMIKGFDYQQIARRVKRLHPERVTLGSLRAESNLPRFAGKTLFAGLQKPSNRTGLARYSLNERLALYSQATAILSGLCPIGLCEETPAVWKALRLNTRAKPCNCGS